MYLFGFCFLLVEDANIVTNHNQVEVEEGFGKGNIFIGRGDL